MGQMIDAAQHIAELLAVVRHAADRGAAEPDPVIAALATDKAGPRRFAVGAVIGQGDFQRRIHGFRSGIGEKNMVEIARQHIAEF